MKKMMTLALVTVASLFLHQPTQAQTIDEIKTRGKILVAFDSANPPYGTMDKDNKPGGYDYRIAETIAPAKIT